MSRAAKKRRLKSPKQVTKEIDTDIESEYIEHEKVSQGTSGDTFVDSLFDSVSAIYAGLNSEYVPKSLLQLVMSPVKIEEFRQSYFEKQPLLVNRQHPLIFEGLANKHTPENIINNCVLKLGVDIEIRNLSNSKLMQLQFTSANKCEFKEVDNAEPNDSCYEITSTQIWKRLKDGNYIVLLSPQKHDDAVWKFVSYLECYWNIRVDSRLYVIPPGVRAHDLLCNSHDVYILQLQGQSAVQVYKPREEAQELPRVGSARADTADYVRSGMVDATLSPGDTLYIPKGWVYSLSSCGGEETSCSLHLLTNEFHTIADVLEYILPEAVKATVAQGRAYRESLPWNVGDFMGVSSQPEEEEEEEESGGVDGETPAPLTPSQKRKRQVAQEHKTLLRTARLNLRRKIQGCLQQVLSQAMDILDGGLDQVGGMG